MCCCVCSTVCLKLKENSLSRNPPDSPAPWTALLQTVLRRPPRISCFFLKVSPSLSWCCHVFLSLSPAVFWLNFWFRLKAAESTPLCVLSSFPEKRRDKKQLGKKRVPTQRHAACNPLFLSSSFVFFVIVCLLFLLLYFPRFESTSHVLALNKVHVPTLCIIVGLITRSNNRSLRRSR